VKRGVDCAGDEAEINALVAKLYGLLNVFSAGRWDYLVLGKS